MSTTCSIASLYNNGSFPSYSKKVRIASEAILDGKCKLLHRIGQVQRQSTTLCRICSYYSLEAKLSGFVNFLWSSYKSWILPRFKYRDFNKSINNRFDMHTANVYRDLRVLYREIRVRGFQIYGDCMLPTIPVILK